MNAQHGHRRFGWLLVAPAVVILLVIGVLPFLYAIYLALFKSAPNPAIPPKFDPLGNISSLFRDPQFVSSLRVTAIMVVVAVTVTLILGVVLALALSRIRHGRSIVVPLLVIPAALAPIVVGVTWWMMFSTLYGPVNGVLNQFLGIPNVPWTVQMPHALMVIVIGVVWQTIPITALIALGGLLSVPPNLIEAAQIDGAGTWRTLRSVQLPLIRPHLVIAMLLTTVAVMFAYEIPFFTTEGGPGNETVTVGIYLYKLAFTFVDYGRAAAMSVMFVIAISVAATAYAVVGARRRQGLGGSGNGGSGGSPDRGGSPM